MQTLHKKWKIGHVVQSRIPLLQPANSAVELAINWTRKDYKTSTVPMAEINSTKQPQKRWAAFPVLIQRLTNGQPWTSSKLWECTKRSSKRSRLNSKENKFFERSSKSNKLNSLQGKKCSSRIGSSMQGHAKRELAEKRLLKKPGRKQKRRKLRRSRSGVNNIQLSAKWKKCTIAKLLWRQARNWSKKMWNYLKMHSSKKLSRRRKLKTTGSSSMKKSMALRNSRSLKENTRKG